ncbi:MAG: flagellin lysine-N-methylase [Syntrophomonadaceae bacterium]
MKKNTRPVLMPHYLRSFACIGSRCEDSCCIGWGVGIDRRTYKKYKQVKDRDLKTDLEHYVARNRSQLDDGFYALIRLNSEASCPFLSEEKLCRIQAGIGEDYLSDVCTTYPRISNNVNGILEKSATLSCPEAARLALLNQNPMEFDEIEEKINVRNIISREFDTRQFPQAYEAQEYFWELRIFTIQVLQNRDFNVGERLIVLGMFYQKLDQLIADNLTDQIPGLIASYNNMLSSSILRSELDKIPAQVIIQMKLLKELTDERIQKGVNSQRYLDYFRDCLIGLMYRLEDTIEERGERYRQAEKSYYRPFMNDHEYIIENYLVNHVFKSLFPFSDEHRIFNNYVLLVVHYALIKMHLIGMAGFNQGLTEELTVDFIQCFVKVVEHHERYLKRIMELLGQAGYLNMAYMAILIKN